MKKLLFILLLSGTAYSQTCEVPAGFKEPVGDKKNQKFLKITGAQVIDMKNHVAVDLGVTVQDITILSMAENKGDAVYILCIKGKQFKYKRVGSVFHRDNEDPLKFDDKP